MLKRISGVLNAIMSVLASILIAASVIGGITVLVILSLYFALWLTSFLPPINFSR